jgi:hypothetical protein
VFPPAFRECRGNAKIVLQCLPVEQSAQEDVMAKGQMRSPKEKKKPKADTAKVKQLSAYKAAQVQSGKK